MNIVRYLLCFPAAIAMAVVGALVAYIPLIWMYQPFTDNYWLVVGFLSGSYAYAKTLTLVAPSKKLTVLGIFALPLMSLCYVLGVWTCIDPSTTMEHMKKNNSPMTLETNIEITFAIAVGITVEFVYQLFRSWKNRIPDREN